jgi:hypothetical protein
VQPIGNAEPSDLLANGAHAVFSASRYLTASLTSVRITVRFSGGPRSGPSAATGC